MPVPQIPFNKVTPPPPPSPPVVLSVHCSKDAYCYSVPTIDATGEGQDSGGCNSQSDESAAKVILDWSMYIYRGERATMSFVYFTPPRFRPPTRTRHCPEEVNNLHDT